VQASRSNITNRQIRNNSRSKNGYTIITSLAVAAILGSTGCNQSSDGLVIYRANDHSSQTSEANPPAESDHNKEQSSTPYRQRPVIVRQISFDILQTRVAKGVFSESGKIWNHLDGEAIPAQTSLFLQGNGLRVAKGKLDSWRPIKALLEQEKDLESSQTQTPKGSGAPFTMAIHLRPREQTLFIARRDGRVAGATYPDSTNYLQIEYGFSATNPDAVIVSVIPLIKLPHTEHRFEAGPQGLVEHPSYRPVKMFRELAFQMELGPDDFVVIGPAQNAHHGHLAGSLFLCEEIEGRKYESMYFITPRIHQKKVSNGN